mgnify:CR=1 FL=1
MIDLIKEIERLTDYLGDSECHYNTGVYDCLDILNQYNIITAPKSIKLSEIVKRMNDFYETDEYIVSKENNKIYSGVGKIIIVK